MLLVASQSCQLNGSNRMARLAKVGDGLEIPGGSQIHADSMIAHPCSERRLVQLGRVVTLL